MINNYYKAIKTSSSAVQKRVIIVCQNQNAPEDEAFCKARGRAAGAYVAGNFSHDGWTEHVNTKGTRTTPFSAPSVDTTDACTAADEVLADAGVYPPDKLDAQYLSAISLAPCDRNNEGESNKSEEPAGSDESEKSGETGETPDSQGIVELQITDPGNSAIEVEEKSNKVKLHKEALVIGKGRLVGLRFTNVAIPHGAIIESATLELYGYSDVTEPIVIRYLGEKAGNSAPWNGDKGELSRRAKTSAFVDDIPGPWPLGDFNVSAELDSIIEEIVGQSEWAMGNSLTLFVADLLSPSTRWLGSAETDPALGPVLRVRYRMP